MGGAKRKKKEREKRCDFGPGKKSHRISNQPAFSFFDCEGQDAVDRQKCALFSSLLVSYTTKKEKGEEGLRRA